jgi:sec-independent protein translocase protein TatB
MFDIGIGEIIVIGVIGLLVFGPEKLPRAAADATKWLRQIRGMATGARKELADSAGLDLADAVDSVKELRDLHPRRLAASLLEDSDDDAPPSRRSASPEPGGSARPTYDPDAT